MTNLRCGDDRLASVVALLYHHFLRQEYLFRGYLHAQIASGHHDAVRGRKNVIEILDALLIFHFRYDLYLPPVFAQHLLGTIYHLTL